MKNDCVSKQKVISLIRVSSEQQAADDRTGIQRQLEDIGIHCRSHNLEIIKEYRLDGISGAYVQHSPSFQEMLSKLSEPSIAGIVFASIDRFFRPEGLSAYQVFAPFENTGKRLFCDLGALDPKNQQDQMKIVLWGQMAGMERTRIRDRMVRGKEFKRLDPNSKTDTLPNGVVLEGGKFRYTDQSERVKQAFYRVLKGDTLTLITKELGFTSQTALRATLRSYWWIGVKATTKRRVERKPMVDVRLSDGKKIERENPIFVKTNLAETPLIPEAIFERIQDVLNQNTRHWIACKSRTNNFLGVGLLYCQCGEKMYAKSDKRPGKPSYYICASKYHGTRCSAPRLRAIETDTEIWWSIMTYLCDERFIALKVKEAMGSEHEAKRKRETRILQKMIADLERKKKNLMEAIADIGYDPKIGQRIKELDGQQTTAKTKLNALGEAEGLQSLDAHQLAKQIKQTFWGFSEWSKERQKRVLSECVQRITLDDQGRADFTVRVGLPMPNWKSAESGGAVSDWLASKLPVANNKSRLGMD
jgi:DNA invertase Pin-like site-specific DNA recombinase